MKLHYLLVAVALATFPIAALTSCTDSQESSGKTAAEAKYHYAVAMTGVV